MVREFVGDSGVKGDLLNIYYEFVINRDLNDLILILSFGFYVFKMGIILVILEGCFKS